MALKELNVFLAGLLAFEGFLVLAISIYFEPRVGAEIAGEAKGASKPYHTAFLLFWALAWTSVLFDWVTTLYRDQWGGEAWLNWTIDTAENFLFGAAAYVLFRRERFRWNDRYLRIALALLPASIILGALPLFLVSRENLFFKLLFTSADVLMFVVALIAIGIAIFLEKDSAPGRVRGTVLAVFIVFALIQIPNSIVGHMDPHNEGVARQVIRTLLAGSKIALFFAMIVTVASFYRATLAVPLMKSVRWGSLILGAACNVLLAFISFRRLILAVIAG